MGSWALQSRPCAVANARVAGEAFCRSARVDIPSPGPPGRRFGSIVPRSLRAILIALGTTTLAAVQATYRPAAHSGTATGQPGAPASGPAAGRGAGVFQGRLPVR